jgi:hypothetical protein
MSTPDRTRWSRYLAYECRSCHEGCINEVSLSRTLYRECRHCFQTPVPDRRLDSDSVLPTLHWAAHLVRRQEVP